MKRLLFIFVILLAFNAEAARRLPRPTIGATVGAAVTGGFAVDVKDCYVTTPYATAADTESSSGTILKKTTGTHENGQIACPVNLSANTYYAWAKVKLRGVTQVPERVFWFDTSPFRSGFQNTKGTLISQQVDLPPSTSFAWISVGASLNMATFAQGTTQATFSLGSGSVLYLTGDAVVEFDCLFFATSSGATPICPAGAPSSNITHNATGTAAAASATSSLAPTITVAAGSNKIMFAAVCHRTSTNTISSVSSSVDGAFTLVNWVANDTVAGAVYRLINPTEGAHTVTVSFSQAQNAVAGLVAYNGVSQTAPTSTISTNIGTSTPSLTIAGATDQFAVDHLCISVDNAETVTVNASQTQRYQKEVDIAGGPNRVSAWSDEQGDTSISMDWTITGTKGWAHQAFMIKPPSGAGSPPVLGSPSVTLLGPTSAIVEASVDDPSAQCEAEYDTDTGAPYANNTADVGATGGKCVVTISSLTASTPYFYRINATNGQGTTNGTEGTFNTTSATAVTALGITQAEIDLWNARRTSGPYRSTGDVSSNSPGDFARILSNADSFVASPETVWTGQTAASCWTYLNPVVPGRSRGERARDSAFMFLLTGTAGYKTPVLTLLLNQAGTAGTDFSNTTKWSTAYPGCFSFEPGWEIVQWLNKLLQAYDYIRHTISAGDKTTLDTWFLNAATYIEFMSDLGIKRNFPNHLTDDYTTYIGMSCTSNAASVYHGSTYFHYPFHAAWENTGGSAPTFYGQVGIMLANSTLKARAIRFFQEWMKFNVFADNTSVEYYRGNAAATNLGWAYASTMIGEMVTLADAFARSGDNSLYEYNTSLGFAPCTPAGGPKNLRSVITVHMQHINSAITRYIPGHSGDANYRIGPVDVLHSAQSIGDTYLAPANVYYNDTFIKSAYTRTLSGAPAYPVNPMSGGYSVYGGTWGVMPGILGMFGQMEGLVDPYP